MAGAQPANPYAEDLEFLFRTVFDVHPRPDWRAPMARLEEEMEYCRTRVASCRTAEDLLAIGQRFRHVLGDGHTGLYPAETTRSRSLPIRAKLIDGCVVVDRVVAVDGDARVHSVGRGDAILSVGARDAGWRLDHLCDLASFSNGLAGRARSAAVFHEFVAEDRDAIDVFVAKPSGEAVHTELPLLTSDHPALQEDQRRQDRERILTLIEPEFIDDIQAGRLNYRGCYDRYAPGRLGQSLEGLGLTLEDLPDMEETAWNFFHALSERRWRRLIVDLRGNGGGFSGEIAQHLYKYLTCADLSTYAAEAKVSRTLQEVHGILGDEPVGSIKRWDERVLEYPYQSRLDHERERALGQFDGEIVVLTDALTFSNGEWLAAELRANIVGTFIGEPTGQGGSVPGESLPVKLPNSGMELCVADKYFHLPEGAETGYPGIMPDYYVKQTLDDYRTGRDTVMEFVRSMWS